MSKKEKQQSAKFKACGCKSSTLDYLAWHKDAERRFKRGQRQRYCIICNHWRWKNELGPNSQTIDAEKYKEICGE